MEQYRNQLQDQRLSKIEKHIETINSELGEVKNEMAAIKERVNWLCKTYWVVCGASISGLMVGIFNLLIK